MSHEASPTSAAFAWLKPSIAMAGIAAWLSLGLEPASAQTLAPTAQDRVEASKKEGKLTVFSNVGEVNWRPVLEAFKKKYSWISVETLDLGASEVFERFYADQASGSPTVDIVLSSSAPQWIEFHEKGMALNYQSAEAGALPDWSKPLPGVYTIATDPFVIAYNKLLLPKDQWPTSLSALASAAKAKPDQYNKKMGTYAPNSSGFSRAIFYGYAQHGGDKAVSSFDTLGPMTELYRSVGPVLEKITTGEYVAGYFISGITLLPLLRDPARAQVIGWNFDSDGTVLIARSFAISKSTKDPNSAALFTDFILSKEGQQAVGAGGLVPYRPDVDPSQYQSGLSYGNIVEKVGATNVVTVRPDKSAVDAMTAFGAKTKAMFRE